MAEVGAAMTEMRVVMAGDEGGNGGRWGVSGLGGDLGGT